MWLEQQEQDSGVTEQKKSVIAIWQGILCQARQVSPLWSLTHNSSMLGTFEGAGSVL